MIGGKGFKRRFTVDGESKPFWSPKGQVFGNKRDAESKAQRLKDNAGDKHTRITKEKSGHRVWSRGAVKSKKKK